MCPVRILVADDHEVVLHGLRSLIRDREADWQVVAEARDGGDAVSKAKEFKPDIAILDITMPVLNGIEATRQMIDANRRAKVLIFTMHDSEQLIKSVANAGARGYVLKADAAVDLPRAIQAVLNGQTFFTPKAARVILDGFMSDQTSKEDLESLTPIQRDILHFVVEGRITKDIAALLQVSTKTVEKQRINLMRRFRCHSRSELVRHAIRNHLVRA